MDEPVKVDEQGLMETICEVYQLGKDLAELLFRVYRTYEEASDYLSSAFKGRGILSEDAQQAVEAYQRRKIPTPPPICHPSKIG